MPSRTNNLIKSWLKDEGKDKSVQWTAVETLGSQSTLSETILTALVARLWDEDINSRRVVLLSLVLKCLRTPSS